MASNRFSSAAACFMVAAVAACAGCGDDDEDVGASAGGAGGAGGATTGSGGSGASGGGMACPDGRPACGTVCCDPGLGCDGAGMCVESGTVIRTPVQGNGFSVMYCSLDGDELVAAGGVGLSGDGQELWEVRRYDATLAQMWSHKETGSTSHPNGMALSESGDAIVTGTSAQTPQLALAGSYSPAGTVNWTKPEMTLSHYRSPSVDSAGNIVVGAKNTNEVPDREYLAKVTPSGDLAWSVETPDDILATAVSSDDRIFAGSDGWFAGYTADGTEQQRTDLPGVVVNAMAIDADGNLLLAGTEGMMPTTAWVAKYSPAGDELWSRTLDHFTDNAGILHAVVTASGGFIVTGAGMDVGAMVYDTTAFWTRLDSDGNELWTHFHDTPGQSDYGARPAIRANGVVVACTHTGAQNEDHSHTILELAP